MTLPKLSTVETLHPYAEYYYKPLTPIPDEIIKKLEKGPLNYKDVLRFENINKLLQPGYLNDEIGYCVLPDGCGFTAVNFILDRKLPYMVR